MKPSSFDWKHHGTPGLVIGGGPSTTMVSLPITFLNSVIKIGCKQVWRLYPLDYLVSAETYFIKCEWRDKPSFQKTSFIKFIPEGAIKNTPIENDPTYIRLSYGDRKRSTSRALARRTLPTSFENMDINCMSGTLSVRVAYMLGCNPIYLLGLDGVMADTKSHWHNDYRSREKVPDYTIEIWHFIERAQAERRVDFISLSSLSRLNDRMPYKEL
jgi:hypothetical protein